MNEWLFCEPGYTSLLSHTLQLAHFTVMATMDVFGFEHEDLRAARKVIESALSIRLEEAKEDDGSSSCFRWYVPVGPCVQIRSNSGSSLRWSGDPPRAWHPDYGVLVFVHGSVRESVVERLRRGVPGLSFLEKKQTM